MKDNKNLGEQDKSLVKSLIVPILIAFTVGGTAPWWISLFQENGEVSEPAPSREDTEASQISGEFQNDGSLEVQGSNNSVNDNSINAQGNRDQTIVNGTGNNVVQGTGNTVVQGTGNQLTIQQESDARARGEFEIPSISGLPYHEAREILIQEGWIPFTQRHFYLQEEPSLQQGTGKVFWDIGYWEIISCTGTAEGFCRFEFSDPSGRRLVIITAGMEDPNISAHAIVNRVFFDENI